MGLKLAKLQYSSSSVLSRTVERGSLAARGKGAHAEVIPRLMA